jgi:hypothetical protein
LALPAVNGFPAVAVCGPVSGIFFSIAESDFALARILSFGGRARQVFG